MTCMQPRLHEANRVWAMPTYYKSNTKANIDRSRRLFRKLNESDYV